MRYVVGLGSNLGSRHALIEAGLELLRVRTGCRIERVSPYYESDPVGPPQPRYLNSAARIETSRGASALLRELHVVEACFGRTRESGVRFGPRTLDLDILWASAPSGGLAEVPHPRLEERWFCLRPLLNVAPELEPEYAAKLVRLCPEALEIRPRPAAVASSEAASFDGRCPAPDPRAAAACDVRAMVTNRSPGASFDVYCEASDRAEALACALTALVRALAPSTSAVPDAPLRVAGECARGRETTSCAAAVASAVQRGLALHSVTVSELADGLFCAYLTRADTQQTPNGSALTLQATDVHERAVAIRAVATQSETSQR